MKYSREIFILAASYGSVILIESSDKKMLEIEKFNTFLTVFFFLVKIKGPFCVWKFLKIF